MYGEGQRGRTGVGARSAEGPEAGQQGDAEVWNRVKRRLRAELGEDVFTSWFARLELDAVNDGCAHLTVPTRFLKSWIEAHYADRVRSVYRSETPLVATLDKRVVAMCGISRRVVIHRPAALGRITALIVSKELQGEGVGRMLVDAAEEWMRKKGCQLVEVTSNDRRAAAHAFYRHMGYERSSIRFFKKL